MAFICSTLVSSQAGWLLGTLLLLLLALVRCPCHFYHSLCHQIYQFVIIFSVISATIIIPMTTIEVIMTYHQGQLGLVTPGWVMDYAKYTKYAKYIQYIENLENLHIMTYRQGQPGDRWLGCGEHGGL